ncbi:MAG TPA: cytochrome c [Verrucomicrobiae bacterium]|jgi:sulfite dehydrogenase (cytochrome) subunit B|nr:cytochrome c [Verrucomicrobiae bacterium]
MKTLLAGLLVVLLGATAWAQEKRITLPPDHAYGHLTSGPGRDVTQTQCQVCHSTDYIVMQPRGDAKQWEGVVTKMIKVFGAPVTEADAKTITDYLARTYGPPR